MMNTTNMDSKRVTIPSNSDGKMKKEKKDKGNEVSEKAKGSIMSFFKKI